MKLIVGLGNPGPAYARTRHNVGFVVLDQLAKALGTEFAKEKYKGLIAQGNCAGRTLLLLKPLTFMNLSGQSVALAARNRLQQPEELLVVYDDAELALGTLRIRKGGSPGSHNGMKSVVEHLGTRDFLRMRLGVGAKATGSELTDHVLGKFMPDEREAVDDMIERGVQAALRCVESGVDSAMNEFNETKEH